MEREDPVDGPVLPSGEKLEGKALLWDQCSGRVAQSLQPLGSAGLHNAFESQGELSYLSVPTTVFQGTFLCALSHILNKTCIFLLFFFLFCLPRFAYVKHDCGFHCSVLVFLLFLRTKLWSELFCAARRCAGYAS